MVKQTEKQQVAQEVCTVDLSLAWLMNDNTLEQQPDRYSAPVLVPFKSDKDFTDLITGNTSVIFGVNTILINAQSTPLECYVILDYTEEDRHLIHFVDVTLSKVNFWEVFVRGSKLFTLLSGNDYAIKITSILVDLIAGNGELADDIFALAKQYLGEENDSEVEMGAYLENILSSYKPFVVLLSDAERPEFFDIATTYPSNWGKYTLPLVLNKYSDDGTMFCMSTPRYADIEWEYSKFGGGAKEKEKGEGLKKSTEEDHLNNTQAGIKDIYLKVKGELLKDDASLSFNPKAHYIAMRKSKNLAFFTIKKKSISIVVMMPESEVKKLIKQYQVKTLAQSVQKYWNGECCTVVATDEKGLDELVVLLKKLGKK